MERSYRLFVRSLPNNITNDKLHQLFNKYGSINAVDVKEKSMNDGSKFAFINITSTDQKLNNCYREINSTVLEGKNLSVELAKESFLDKLKREREEAQIKTTDQLPVKIARGPLEPINIKIPDKLKQTNKQKSVSSQSKKLNQDQDLPEFNVDHSFRIKENNINLDVTDNNAHSKCESELKRVASLKQRKQSFKAKQQLLRKSLKTVDNKKNKILFSDDVESSGNNYPYQKKPSNNYHLFNEDSDDNEHDDITFDHNKKYKPQAQSIGNDSRFIMNDKFNDEEEKEESSQSRNDESDTSHLNKEKDELAKEKERELKILEDVLGKSIIKRHDQTIPSKKTNTMIRYDPTKDHHRKHELKIEEKTSETKKKKKKKEIIEEKEEPIPVSNEIFYSVSDNLKESLNKKEEGFSLLRTFGTDEISESRNDNDFAEAVSNQPPKLKVNSDIINPFRYDSSESEDEDLPENSINTRNIEFSNDSFYVDTFFLIDNDPRLKDAEEFFEVHSTSKTPFKELRRELKNIVRSKVRNNVRKTLPWKKKISNVKRVSKKHK